MGQHRPVSAPAPTQRPGPGPAPALQSQPRLSTEKEAQVPWAEFKPLAGRDIGFLWPVGKGAPGTFWLQWAAGCPEKLTSTSRPLIV